jgi:hypothetical protein
MPGQGHPAALPGSASLIAAGLGGAEALLDGDQVSRGQQPDPSVAARHVIGRHLDLSHVSWRTCVADLLADHMTKVTKVTKVLAQSVPRRSSSS